MQGVGSQREDVPQRWSAGHEVAVHPDTQSYRRRGQHGTELDSQILPAPQSESAEQFLGGGFTTPQYAPPHEFVAGISCLQALKPLGQSLAVRHSGCPAGGSVAPGQLGPVRPASTPMPPDPPTPASFPPAPVPPIPPPPEPPLPPDPPLLKGPISGAPTAASHRPHSPDPPLAVPPGPMPPLPRPPAPALPPLPNRPAVPPPPPAGGAEPPALCPALPPCPLLVVELLLQPLPANAANPTNPTNQKDAGDSLMCPLIVC